jgi:hypothetical protein
VGATSSTTGYATAHPQRRSDHRRADARPGRCIRPPRRAGSRTMGRTAPRTIHQLPHGGLPAADPRRARARRTARRRPIPRPPRPSTARRQHPRRARRAPHRTHRRTVPRRLPHPRLAHVEWRLVRETDDPSSPATSPRTAATSTCWKASSPGPISLGGPRSGELEPLLHQRWSPASAPPPHHYPKVKIDRS